ncbi:MAG: type II secretion system F family protein [Nanobdellota archaeon]
MSETAEKPDMKAKDIKKEVSKGISFKEKRAQKKRERAQKREQARKEKQLKKKMRPKRNFRQFFEHYLPRAGLEGNIEHYKQKILLFSVLLAFFLYLGATTYAFLNGLFSPLYLLFITFVGIPLLFIIAVITIMILFVIYIETIIYRRKTQIETVFPDFLQLAAANTRSGMTIDRALWAAIRPQFGVLAKEIELVAKETMSGVDLQRALLDFSQKYDSATVQRSIQLMIEGINAGGHIAEILDRIALNLEETAAMQKEMAANVTSYVMFILFATLVAAPGMYGLSKQLIAIVTDIMGRMGDAPSGGSGMGLSIGGGGGLSVDDFTFFANLSISATVIFAGLIVSIIKTGTVRSELKKIPVYLLIAFGVFKIADMMLSAMFSGMF